MKILTYSHNGIFSSNFRVWAGYRLQGLHKKLLNGVVRTSREETRWIWTVFREHDGRRQCCFLVSPRGQSTEKGLLHFRLEPCPVDDDDDGNACLIEIGVGVDFNAEIKVVLALVVVTSFSLDATRLAKEHIIGAEDWLRFKE